MRRSKWVGAIASITLVVVLGSWFRMGWKSAALEAKELKQAPLEKLQKNLSQLAAALVGHLDTLRVQEDARPYYHYQNLFHDPLVLSNSKSLRPSPLVASSGDPLIRGHFQIDSEGRLTIPPINEELEQFSSAEGLEKNTELLASLRRSVESLRDPIPSERPLVALRAPSEAAPKQMVLNAQAPVQQQAFRPEDFTQNMAPNQVFRDLEAGRGAKGLARDEAATVQVSTHGFTWREASIDGAEALVAVRRIETPAGNLEQGFVLDSEALAAWLADHFEMEHPVALVAKGEAEGMGQDVPALAGFQLVSPTNELQREAGRLAREPVRRFLWRFVPIAVLCLGVGVLLFATVRQLERVARERSQFAAAAAHELRTPLAGLQLYGDMLADGLGDQNAKEKYARRISEEAQRLGRVVSNVLGFSQMERGGVRLDMREQDLASAAERVVERLRPSLEKLGMELDTHLEPTQAVFDEDAVSRILENLLDNAEKYSRGADARRLAVHVGEDGASARLAVCDSGPGVRAQARQQIFGTFKRQGREDGPAGLGLGLSLARALAEEQGGSLRVTDAALGGAEFVLELPKASS